MKPTLALLFCYFCFPGNDFAGELDPGPAQQKWFQHYAKQENVPKPEEMLVNTQPEPELTAGFIGLFNGKDLDDWETIGGTSTFEVKDGAIRGVRLAKSDSTYLYTKKPNNTKAGEPTDELYRDLYQPGLCPDLRIREHAKQPLFADLFNMPYSVLRPT